MHLNDPLTIFGIMLGFVIGVTIHEFMHAWSAWYLGDDTAKRLGRITLNPVAHFDPLGFFMFILLALGIGLIGWGRPVPVNPAALRNGRRGMAIVAFAGPASNVVIALIFGIPLRLGLPMPDPVLDVISNIVYVNVLMFAFNLIPVPPLDGYNILTGILSNYWAMLLEPLRRYGPALLLVVLFAAPYLRIDIFGAAITPIQNLIYSLVLGISA